jgi:cell fate regulator YaaT (PSP1 superfamily)
MARGSLRWLVRGRMQGVGTGGLSGRRVIRSQGLGHLKEMQRRRVMMQRMLID